MGKTAKIHKKESNDNHNIIELIILIGILAILFVGSFFQGLFFEGDILIAFIIFGILLMLFAFSSSIRDYPLIKNKAEVCLLIYGLMYIVSIIAAANQWLAILGAMKVIFYLLVFWLVSRINENGKYDNVIINFFIVLSIALCFTGIVSALQIYEFPDAFKGERINSSLQYPNTLAAWLTASSVLTMYQILKQKSIKGFIFLNIAYFIQVFTFFGTLSRGGFLLILGIYLLYIVFNPEQKGKTLVYSCTTGVIAFISSYFFLNLVVQENSQLAVMYFVAGLIINIVSGYIIYKGYDKVKNKVNKKVIAVVLGVIFLIAVIALVEYLPRLKLFDRFAALNIKQSSIFMRFTYYKDSLEMILSQPLVGYGGGGWGGAYKLFRSYGYYSSELHNNILQVAVEIGVVGVVSYLVGLILVFTNIVRNRNIKAWSLIIAALTLFLHGAIDFDFSLPVYSVFFWILLGLINTRQGLTINTNYSIKKIGIAAISVVLVVSSTCFSLANDYSNKAFQIRNANKSILLLEKAAKANPFKAPVLANLAQTKIQQLIYTKDLKYLNEAMAIADKLIKKEKNEPNWQFLKAQYLIINKKYDEAADIIDNAYLLDICGNTVYQRMSNMYIDLAKTYILTENDVENGKKYLQKAVDVYELAKEVGDTVHEDYKRHWTRNRPTQNKELYRSIIQAYIYMNRDSEAKKFLEKSSVGESSWEMVFMGEMKNMPFEKQQKKIYQEALEIREKINKKNNI